MAHIADEQERPRRAGRPRHDGRHTVGDPTEEILVAAGRLFGELGINGTTMARLATEVGLKQSSLYYYFRNRDEVVAELVARANVVPLELARALADADGSPAARLFAFIEGDVVALCRLPLDIGEIHRTARGDAPRFAEYWKGRRRLERLLTALIAAGTEAGEFRSCDAALTALLVMGNDEGVQNWFRQGTRRRPEVIGREVARLTVGGLLADPTTLDDTELAAAEIAATLDA